MSRITFTDATREGVEVETDLSGMALTLANDASNAATVADIMADHRRFHMGVDPSTGPETSVICVIDAGDVYHILPEAEAREWEADGYTIRELPPKKLGEYRPDRVYNLPKLTEQQLRAFGADSWDIAPPKVADLYPSSDPNEGRQAPPPRREWWATQCKGNGTPGLGCQKRDKDNRNAQKNARKKQRSRK